MKTLLLLVAAAASQPPQQFDLVCKGDNGGVHFRVDLSAKQWCWDDCKSTSEIARIEPTKLTFKDIDTPSSHAWNWVDRTTGEWFQGLEDHIIGRVSQHGTCEPAPFSGFPVVRPKF